MKMHLGARVHYHAGDRAAADAVHDSAHASGLSHEGAANATVLAFHHVTGLVDLELDDGTVVRDTRHDSHEAGTWCWTGSALHQHHRQVEQVHAKIAEVAAEEAERQAVRAALEAEAQAEIEAQRAELARQQAELEAGLVKATEEPPV